MGDILQIEIEEGARYIIDKLNEYNFEAYIVGGCVRDSIMNKVPEDWDIATNALPTDVQNIFSKTVPTGIKHGTVTVIVNKKNYEVTTFRIDGGYLDMRRPEKVTFSKSIIDDLSRRDFTINAMAYSYKSGLIDEFYGIEDIKNKKISCVGEPDKRFNEDALRILRAVRFSAKLGFDIEVETYISMRKNSENIKKISIERVMNEIEKIIQSDVSKMRILEDIGILNIIFENEVLNYVKYDFKDKANFKKNTDISYENSLKRALCFYHVNTQQLKDILKKLKYSNKDIHSTLEIHKVLKSSEYNLFSRDREYIRIVIKKILRDIGDVNLSKYAIYSKFVEKKINPCLCFDVFDDIIEKGECFSISQLNINGRVLIENDIAKGSMIGIILNKLLDYVIVNPDCNDCEKLIFLLRNGLFNEN